MAGGPVGPVRLCRLRLVLSSLVVALARQPKDLQATFRRHLSHFTCLTDLLQPHYDALRENALPVGVLHGIVSRCNATGSGGALPELKAEGWFLSRFFVRNCDNWQVKRHIHRSDGKGSAVSTVALEESASGRVSFPREKPVLVKLDQDQLNRHVPRWLWDRGLYTEHPKDRTVVRAMLGHEDELSQYPLFTQGQLPRRGRATKWRQSRPEWTHTLASALEFKPGEIWIEPEIWIQAKGRETTFHYDYDPFNLVFQVEGSRRFHIVPPDTGDLMWSSWDQPWKKSADYGTRWAKQINDTEEYVVELQPGDALYLPNGWPHRVKYTDLSVGYAVRTFTQCQALSLWIGQRLCVLSSLVGGPRLCFDDQRYREHGGHRTLERQM